MHYLLSILMTLAMQRCTAGNAPAQKSDASAVVQESSSSLPEMIEQDEAEVESGEVPVVELPAHLDALLDRIEAGGQDLQGFTAQIRYEKYEALLERREIRSGELLYRVETEPAKKSFALLFDRIIINRRQSTHRQHYIFDGRWLVELNHESNPKQFIKRELVAPGRTIDPLKLGEGPIPLPIGQSKQDVLDRFIVEDVELPEQGMLARLEAESVDGIRLIPRPGTGAADEYRYIDLFYEKATNLPVGIEVVELNDDRKTVRLSEVRRNPEFTPDMRAKLDIGDPDPAEWKIDIQQWDGAR